jgi:hypothetical protein
MDSVSTKVLVTLVRTQRFLDANAAALGTINESGARKELDQAVLDLTGHANVQGASARKGMGETRQSRALRRTLYRRMRQVARVSASKLQGVTEYAALQMPAANARIADVLARAGTMANAAEVHASVFSDAGLPADFVTQLRAAASAIEATLGDRSESGTTRVTATQGTRSACRRGRHAIKVLDSLIRLHLAEDDDLVSGWKSAKRFRAMPAVQSPAVQSPAVQEATPSGTAAT